MRLHRVCPYCIVVICGLVLLGSFPELIEQRTALGPVWLWLVAIPALSAGARRLLLRDRRTVRIPA